MVLAFLASICLNFYVRIFKKQSLTGGVVLLVGLCLFGCLSANAGLLNAHELATISVLSAQGKRIGGLTVAMTPLEVESERKNFEAVAAVYPEGRFIRPDWNLIVDQTKVTFSKEGRFKMRIVLTQKVTDVQLVAVGPHGEREEQMLRVNYPNFALWRADQKDPLKKRHAILTAVGPSYLSYSETLSPTLSQVALTLKVNYLYLLAPPRWDFGLSGYLTVLPLTSNIPGVTARFLGLNARIGYVLPTVFEPWRVSLMGGFYYTTMFVPSGGFGFNNLMGPQFFPVVRRMFGNGDTLMSYFKFSPVGSGLTIIQLSNREIAVGAGWTHRLRGGNAIAYGLDFSDLSVSADGIDIESKSATLSVGYAW